MRLFINSLAASAGGGLTYIRNVIPHLAGVPGLEAAVLAPAHIRKESLAFHNIEFVEHEISAARRLWYEQFKLPSLLRTWRANVLLSAGNFALRRSPVPQILLSRNSIYTSADFYRDLLSRHEYRMWMDTRIRGAIARRSIHWATMTVAPSEAFALELQRWSGARDIVAIHHGFDAGNFHHDDTPLPADVEQKLQAAQGSVKLLLVSHYNYYRNFETLIRALPIIRDSLGGREVKLLLTCTLSPGQNPGAYRPDAAARLVSELGAAGMVAELGTIPYHQLHHLYRRADMYVTPAYTETFAHPLVEAMSCGLPLVASDLPVHREICGDAAIYFSRFSAEALAQCVVQLCTAPDISKNLIRVGQERWPRFSWKQHVQEILTLSERLLGSTTIGLRERKAVHASMNA